MKFRLASFPSAAIATMVALPPKGLVFALEVSSAPSDIPSSVPSSLPSSNPTLSSAPSDIPSSVPSSLPSSNPTLSSAPSSVPSEGPSNSSSPTDAPSVDCVDDDTFRVNNNPSLSCSWVGTWKTEERCLLGKGKKAYDFCVATCNAACQPPPTMGPTFIASNNRCQNDDSWKYKFSGQGCDWVAVKPRRRCKKFDPSTDVKAKVACPGACDLRCICKNTRREFKFKGIPNSGCKDLTRTGGDCYAPAGINGKRIAADFCPARCDDCYPVEIK